MAVVTNLQLFEYEANELRAFEQEGVACFVAKDVCRALGIGNTADASARLDSDEIGIVSIDTNRGPRRVHYVTEPGLYSLILGSRKSQAKRFKRWVTHEVLPAIRKTGQYASKQLTTAEQFLELAKWQVAQEGRQQKLKQRTDELEQRLSRAEAEIGSQNEYFTILAWANLQGRKIDLSAAAALGRRAVALSKSRDMPLGRVSDPRYGTVNTYHCSILEALDLP